ncbi:MAG: helix-turn-helix transcriptional regulator [Nitrospina sp.]|jgi:transcriptional regulator with XRE-family HTH domain|nr:helix-turn-helix transcriptional regulator [Nitrospina sp.]
MRRNIEFEDLGKRIRNWRKDQGLKAKELALKLKISGGSLSEIENGKSFPSALTLANMHLNTNLNVGYVLTGQMDHEKTGYKTLRTLLIEVDADIDHVILKNRKTA